MQTTLYRLLPAPWRRSATPDRLVIAGQFMRFGAVGFSGFLVDNATVYGTLHLLGPYGTPRLLALYSAGLIAYVTSATWNWVLNRLWTFRGQGSGPAHRQWGRFMITNLVGFALNRGTYIIMVTFVATAADRPWIAIAAGSVAGMFVNFSLSRRLVFR
jgi:putative flippase GtrA